MPVPLISRREALQRGVVASLLLGSGFFPATTHAMKPVFEGKTLQEVAQALGAGSVALSKEVVLTVLDVAENGADVPVALSTTLPGVKQLLLFIEKNPVPLVVVFNLSDAVEANLQVRAKMAQTSDVFAVALTVDGKAFFARKEVRVVAGSCG